MVPTKEWEEKHHWTENFRTVWLPEARKREKMWPKDRPLKVKGDLERPLPSKLTEGPNTQGQQAFIA